MKRREINLQKRTGVEVMSGKQDYFRDALEGKKIPILVLDQRWHQLFDVVEKPSKVKRAEEKVNKLLAKQGKVNDDIKELNALKQKLMDNVMQNIQGAETENRNTLPEKRLKADSRLIDDINKKLDDANNLNTTLPKKLEEANKTLMLETMQFCYQTMQDNGKAIGEIAEWLEKTREQAKINAMEKANRESVNKQLYSYLHNIFGAGIINIFDLKYDELYAETGDSPSVQKENQKNKKQP